MEQIPVSEQWFVQHGARAFRTNVILMYHIDIDFQPGCKGTLSFDPIEKLVFFACSTMIPFAVVYIQLPHIKFIHQVQDFYHSLTGQTLQPTQS